jgi:hypothetical protein
VPNRVEELYKRVSEDGGFTFSPRTGFPTSGISVAIPGNEQIVKIGEFDPGDIAGYIKKVMPVLRDDPRNHLGAWFDKENGVVVLDVSRVFRDAAEARQMGIQWKQRAGFNLETFEEIFFGADEGRIAEGAKQFMNRTKQGPKGSKVELTGFGTEGKTEDEIAQELIEWLNGLGGKGKGEEKSGGETE